MPHKKHLPSLEQVEAVRPSRSVLKSANRNHRSLSHALSDWAEDLANYSSLHGVQWFTRTESNAVKGTIFLLSLFIIVALPTYLTYQMILFANDNSVITAVEWKRAKTLEYPNITICHSKYFHTDRLQMYNITNTLANYMTLALDPSLNDFISFMLSGVTGTADLFRKMLEQQALELDQVLTTYNMTLLELFQSVAFPCESFVIYCEEHRVPKVSRNVNGNVNNSCCSFFFNKDPIFTQAGTCYTTNKPIMETFPASFNSFKILADINEDKAPSKLPNITPLNTISRFNQSLRPVQNL